MNYYIDDNKFSLNQLKKRIEETDLIPSRKLLLVNIDSIFNKLNKQGLSNLADLRKELKTKESFKSFVEESRLDEDYLTVLRREIESYFPKPYSINEFDWLPNKDCERLRLSGLKNTKRIYEELGQKTELDKFCNKYKITHTFVAEVFSLSDLTRIQWVSPLFARMIHEAGYNSSLKVANANAEELCEAVDLINKKGNYFKGKVGLRDIKRLIESAKYLSI